MPPSPARSPSTARSTIDRWTPAKVAWYQRALERSDYAARVLEVLAPLLAECDTVLDVGAGCGALALPLAARGARVTALEPSPAMATALEREAARGRRRNLVVIRAAWNEVALAPHDLVLCAHVGPLSTPGSRFLGAASALARRGVAIVRDAPGGDDKFFYGELYPLLLGYPYETSRAQWEETAEEVRRLGFTPEVTAIAYSSDQPFESLEDACDFYVEHMGLGEGRVRATLRSFLAGRLRREGERWVAPYGKQAVVIWWRV